MTQEQYDNLLQMKDKMVDYIKVTTEDEPEGFFEHICILIAREFIVASFDKEDSSNFEFDLTELEEKIQHLLYLFMSKCFDDEEELKE